MYYRTRTLGPSTNCSRAKGNKGKATPKPLICPTDQRHISIIETRMWESQENLKEVQTFVREGAAWI